jgi:hypothetical protein
MDRIDPNYLLIDTIKIRDDCPSEIKYLATWIKGMKMYQDIDFVKDEEHLIKFFTTWTNTSSPQKVLLNLEIKEEKVKELYKRVVEWLTTKEVFE